MKDWKLVLELIVFLLVYLVIRLGFLYFPQNGSLSVEVLAVVISAVAITALFFAHIANMSDDLRVLLASFKMLTISTFGFFVWKAHIDDGLSFNVITITSAFLVIVTVALLSEFLGNKTNRGQWKILLIATVVQTALIVITMWQIEVNLPVIN